jgi:hypothetical protein
MFSNIRSNELEKAERWMARALQIMNQLLPNKFEKKKAEVRCAFSISTSPNFRNESKKHFSTDGIESPTSAREIIHDG